MSEPSDSGPDQAKVYLVGAGPGDPDLITLRGWQLVQRADALVYDSLVPPEIVAKSPAADKLYVGKTQGGHAMSQDEITADDAATDVPGRTGKGNAGVTRHRISPMRGRDSQLQSKQASMHQCGRWHRSQSMTTLVQRPILRGNESRVKFGRPCGSGLRRMRAFNVAELCAAEEERQQAVPAGKGTEP